MRILSLSGRMAGVLALVASVSFGADLLKREPEVPAGFQFIRTLDVEGFVERINYYGRGAQTFRLRTRYLDPDVNAFVGMLTGVSHFNQNLYIGDPNNPDTAVLLWNWGADVGIKRGRHLWELDLMGAVLGNRLGPAVAIVGEHELSKRWALYHRTEANLFTGDVILDMDQGIWYRLGPVHVTIGYRLFNSRHMNRDGPRVGILLRFESPKIPFLFPSIG
ncbi:MAG: hypothetical protein WC859_10660 [Elusimicrobiota bacterium]|jgi:hypothetical protein